MPLLPISVFATLQQGYAANAGPVALPFVVRACGEFAEATCASVRSQFRLEQSVTGYAKGVTHAASGRDALAAWDALTLDFNIVDSASTRGHLLLPAIFRENGGQECTMVSVRLAYCASPAAPDTCGDLHMDPPYGSNWQYLAVGDKTWYCIDPASLFSLTAYRASGPGSRPGPPDVVALAAEFPVHAITIGAGDFIAVPLHWAHAVLTTR